MHKWILSAVSTVLFALLSIVAGIIVDLNNQFIPLELGVKAAVHLDFSDSELVSEEAYRQMGLLSDRLGLGLVKVAPDLGGDLSGQVFVQVGAGERFPGQIRRFGGRPDSPVRDSTALAHTYSSGPYFITGDTAHLEAFKAWLAEQRVDSRWSESSLFSTLELLVRQSDFGASLLAAAALMVSLVLYWLSVRARGRALRVLAGVPTWRIQIQDLSGFLVGMTAAGLGWGVLAIIYVGAAQGWVFVPAFAQALLTLELAVIGVTALGAAALSAASWPSAEMLARREPAVKSLRAASVAWRAVIFVMVLAAAAPALRAYRSAREAASEQAQWKILGDQVVLSFPAWMGESGMQQVMPDVGEIVQTLEGRQAVALSYTWSREHMNLNDFDLGPYDYLSLVNPRWLDLMLPGEPTGEEQASRPGLVPLPIEQLPEGVRQFLGDHMPLWTRQRLGAAEGLHSITFYGYAGPGTLPVMHLSGDLGFSDRVVVGVVPGLYDLLDDSFLISAASSRNLVFTGLGQTQEQIDQHGLREMVRVRYVAEEGILRAQFTAYFAQLRAGSLAALFVALVVSTVVGAFISAVLNARRDFPLRLAGKAGWQIWAGRVAREWAAGAVLALPVILASGPDGRALAAAAAAAALLITPLAHQAAAGWVFAHASLRRF